MLPELIAEALFLTTQFLEKIKNQDWEQLGKDIISFFLLGIRGMYDLAVEGVTELIDKIWTTITDTDWFELGSNILDGIVNGLSNMGNKISEWGEGFIGGIADFFGIHSPSRLMRDEIGRYLGLGIQEGLASSLPDMGQISSEISDGFNPDFQMPDIDFDKISAQMRFASASVGASAMPMMTTNNYYNSIQNANAPMSQQGDLIIPVSIGVQEIETFVFSAIQLENMRSGGAFL